MFVLAMECSRNTRSPFGDSCPLTTKFSVVIATEIHPFPFRTRKLSPFAPMVLGGRPPGRVGRRRFLEGPPHRGGPSPFWPDVTALVARWSLPVRSEEHTSELQSLMRISYAIF